MKQFIQEHGAAVVLWLVILFAVAGPPGKAALEKKQRIVLDKIASRPTRRLFKAVFGIWTFFYSARGEYPGISILELSVAVAGGIYWSGPLVDAILDQGIEAGSLHKLGVVLGCAALPAVFFIIFSTIRGAWRELSREEDG